MSSRITVVGSINMDLVIRTPRMPLPGETLKGHDFHVIPGGKGANQAVAAARQGAEVTLVGRVGDDDFGRKQRDDLWRNRIDTTWLTIDAEQSTGIAMIAVDKAGQNSIIISPGANGSITPQQIERSKEAICRADILICQLEIPFEAVYQTIELAYDQGVPIILNPAPAPDHPINPALLKKIQYIIPNESEAEALTGMKIESLSTIEQVAFQLQRLGAQTVILTLGENGVFAIHDGTIIHKPAVSVEAVDTTAAGDVFVGSFAVALTEGHSVPEAITFAQYAAALSVTHLGAQSSIPTRQEVDQFVKNREKRGYSKTTFNAGMSR